MMLSLVSCNAIAYFILILMRQRNKNENEGEVQSLQNSLENGIQTMSDFFQVLLDMMFLDSYLSTALVLPIVLNQSLSQEEILRLKTRANKQRWAFQGFLFILLISWTVVSILTGDMFYRMLVFGLQSILLSVFIISLVSIGRQLRVL